MDTPWLAKARTYLGIHEGPGSVDNPVILEWAKDLNIPWIQAFYQHDSIAWCGLFVGMIMHACGFSLPSNPLGALNWKTWGQPLSQGALGAVMVFERDGGGHVAFYLGEDADAYHTLGGNQSDAVTATDRIPKSRCVGIRWPSGVALPTGQTVVHLDSSSGSASSEA